MLLRHQRLKLIGLAVVILFCYSLSALFQEKVLRRPYDGERFTFAFAFTAVQCIIYAAVAKAVITVRDHPKNETPQRYFCIIGVFYVLGKVTSYIALRYVPYPTQVVGKSSKPIPIMLLGVLIGRKTYTAYKYLFVTIIVIGVALFSFKEKYTKKDGEDPILGIIFIGVSLLMDGFLGAFEDRMRSVKKPTPLNLMLFMNSWNSLYLLTYLICTSEGVEFFYFCHRHPIVIRDMSVIVFFGIFGQFCITSMIANFGALPLSITTTIRKFVTVLLSVIVYNNELTTRQWIAAAIIFGALFLDGYFSKGLKKKDKKESTPANDREIENGGENCREKENENPENYGIGESSSQVNNSGLTNGSCLKHAETSHENRQSALKSERGVKKKVRISLSFDDIPENEEVTQKTDDDNAKKSKVQIDNDDDDDDVFAVTEVPKSKMDSTPEIPSDNALKIEESPEINNNQLQNLTESPKLSKITEIHSDPHQKDPAQSTTTECLKTNSFGIINDKTDDTRL